MADVFSKAKRSEVMAAIRSKGNRDTELSLLRIFREYKIKGWRRHMHLVGRPDFTFPKAQLVVFVDGCFWHNCPKHGRNPDSNQSYWSQKIFRNKTRDRKVANVLRRTGWSVLRIWEHDLVKEEQVARRVLTALGGKQKGT